MDSKKRILITIVSCAFFMEGLDATIINTALPQIAHTLGTDPLHLKIALTAYLLAAGIIIPISGWMADRFGVRRIFTNAILLFLVGSIACGLSHSLTELVIARIIQGAGGALSLPVGRLLFVRNFSKKELPGVMSLTATFGLLGPSLSPLLGGALTTYLTWRAIFFVNIPVGCIGFYFALRYIENYKDPKVKRFDFLGFSILSIALACILTGLDSLIDPILNELFTAFILCAGFAVLFLYVLYAKGRDYALISLALFKEPTFSIAVLGSLFIRLAISASPFLIPLLLQVGFGYSPMISGILTAISAGGMLITKLFVNQTLTHFGHRRVLIINGVLLSISTLSLSLLALHPPMIVMALLILCNGIVISLQFTAMNTLSYSSIPQTLQASGSSFISSFQQLMSSFSIACAALMLEIFLHSRFILHTYSPPAFGKTFMVMALFPLLGCFVFMKLKSVNSELLR